MSEWHMSVGEMFTALVTLLVAAVGYGDLRAKVKDLEKRIDKLDNVPSELAAIKATLTAQNSFLANISSGIQSISWLGKIPPYAGDNRE